MIELKDIQGNVIYTTEINKGAKRKYQLMKEDYITLPFSLETPITFGVGCNTEVNGELFEVTDSQKPTYNNATGGYDYQLRLDAYYWKWKNKIFKFTPEVGGQEASWSLTASLDVHLNVFLANLKALGYTYRGTEFGFSIDATVENKAISMTYENTNMIDALSAMAESWQCEWWITDNIINFGRCEYGIAVDFEIHKNVAEMTSSASQSPYATRLYVFGSTNNIPTNYRPANESLLVNGVVQKRLMLPEGTPYLDAYEGMKQEEAIEEVVIIEDIYPKTDGKIDSVDTYEDSVENEDGTTTTETFYRFTDDGINFSKDYIIEGQELKVKFTSGSLNGMEFGVVFNPNEKPEKLEDGTWNIEAQLYEVVTNEDYGRKLPDSTLHPKKGDNYVLIGWDSTKIADLGLISKAENELLSEGRKLLEKRKIDPNTYNCKMFSDYMFGLNEEGEQDSAFSKIFEIGDKVKLINPAYFENGRESRIIGYEYNLDFPYDSPIYTIGETASYSRLGELENKLDALTYKGQTYTSGNGNGVYIIGTNDTTKPTNKNVFSAARTEKDFLSKQKDDRSKGKISSDKGFEAGEFIPEVAGAACYQDKDGNWHIETDHLKVRKKASFTEVEIETTYHVGGQQISTGASMVVDYVLEMDSCYRCYFLKKDNNGRVTTNKWKPKDQAYCNTFNLVKQEDGTLSNHYLWRLVNATSNETADEAETRTFGDVTINTADYHFTDLSKTVFAEGSDIPKAMDEIVLLGHQGNDESRQGCIIVAGAGEGSPYIYEFTGIGIEPFTLPEPETKIKPNDNMFTGVMHIQGNSTGAANLTDLNIGAVNLLLNSGFTGDYKAEDLDETYNLKSGTELFSRGMKHWTGTATIGEDEEAVSGKSAYIGKLSQSVLLIKGENYVVSFKAKGVSLNVSVGDKNAKQELTSNYEHYSLKFVSDGVSLFTISGDATICDLQLERGIVATDWNPSPYDNDKALAALQAVKYLQDAICEGDTTILGGLILSSMIQLGNYKDGKMQKVNAGMSGIYNDDDDVAFWGGGTFESAIRTVMKFKQNPSYKPTDEEWKEMSNFVVSHGGDLFLRGYIHAEGGVFRGRLEANEGYFHGRLEQGNGATLLESDGSGHLANQAIRWGTNGLMYRKATDVIVWTRPNQEKGIDFNEGSYFDLSWAFPETPEQHTPTFVLPVPPADKYRICISVKQYFGIGSGKLLGSFQLYDFEQGKVDICSTVTIYQFSPDEFWLTYYVSDGCWRVDTSNYQVSNKVATLGFGGSSSSSGRSSSGGTTSGISRTVSISDDSGTHKLTFSNGLITQYNFEQRVVDEDE